MRCHPVVAAVAALLALPASGLALTVSKASLSGGQLRIEGSGALPGGFVTAASYAGTAGARADTGGAFKLSAAGFVAEDCSAVVSDGSTPIAIPALAGCVPVAPRPVSPTLPAPTGACTITAPAAASSFHAGDRSTLYFLTSGCSTSAGAVRWSLVAGRVPPGLHGPFAQGQSAANLIGTPVAEGTYTFTLQATDWTGNFDLETFTIVVTAPRPVGIVQTTLPAGLVGRAYQVNLTGDGGLPGYLWSVSAGTLPRGLSLTRNMLAGAATAPGTYAFTVRATDSRGASGTRSYSLVIA